jgi:large subunit ribosomal protein L29
MKYTELQDKTLEELQTLLKEKKVELFENRIKLRTMQLTDSSVIRKIKKDIARINTAISAKGQ